MSTTLRNLPKEHISVSQLNCYKGCPEKYRRIYVLKEKPSNYTSIESYVLGNSFHKFEKFRLSDKTKEINKDASIFFINDLVDRIKTNKIRNQGENSVFEFLKTFSSLKDIRGDYIVDDVLPLFKTVLLEEDYNLYISGYTEKLKSKIAERPSYFSIYKNIVNYYLDCEAEILSDIIIKEPEKQIEYVFERYGKEFSILAYLDFEGINANTGIPVINDWKVAKTKKRIEDVCKEQDIIYSYLVYKIKGVIPEFRYNYFIYSPKTGNVQRQTFKITYKKEALETVEASIHSVARGINEQVFYRNETHWSCKEQYCQFYKSCQANLETTNVIEVIPQLEVAA